MATFRPYFLYGRHAAAAALANPERKALRLILAKGNKDLEPLAQAARKRSVPLEERSSDQIAGLLPNDAVHQGAVLEVQPLPEAHLEEAARLEQGQSNLVVVLDQVTDPHNIGAVFRSAAAFGAKAIVTQDRHAPPESGALAKAASGALDQVPWVRATNLARALDQLFEMGYWRMGLDGAAETALDQADLGDSVALVVGAEGEGLRRLTKEKCDLLARIPISRRVESLNVSNAAAIALYALSR